MAGMHPTLDGDGHLTYPCYARALKKVGLYSISYDIGVRWQTISNYIDNQAILKLCWNGVRKHGSSPRMFWWDQPMKLDKETPDGANTSNSNTIVW